MSSEAGGGPTIARRAIEPLLAHLRARGVDTDALLRARGIDPASFQVTARAFPPAR